MMNCGAHPFWTVVQTESQREALALHGIERAGFECYLPQIKIKHRGERKIVPLFPAYLFVRIVDRWHSIAWSVGVMRILMAGEHPARLADEIVDEIRKREGRDGVIRFASSGPSVGSRVRVVTGQFRGHIGLYDGMSSRERERVLLDLLGRAVPVELAPNDQVEMLPAAAR